MLLYRPTRRWLVCSVFIQPFNPSNESFRLGGFEKNYNFVLICIHAGFKPRRIKAIRWRTKLIAYVSHIHCLYGFSRFAWPHCTWQVSYDCVSTSDWAIRFFITLYYYIAIRRGIRVYLLATFFLQILPGPATAELRLALNALRWKDLSCTTTIV